MKADVTAHIKQLDGETTVQFVRAACPVCQRPQETEDLTLRLAITSALVGEHPHEMNERTGQNTVPPDKKLERFNLAMRVYDNDEVDLKAEDITLIKNLIGKTRNPLIIGRVSQLLKV